QAIGWFVIDAVGRAPARFDFAKLDNLNGHYIRLADDAQLARLVADRLERTLGRSLSEAGPARLRQAMPERKLRPRTLAELAGNARFLVAPRPIHQDDKAAKLLTSEARQMLAELPQRLAHAEWRPERLEEEIRSFADEK